MEGSIPSKYIPDPDPGGPKTYGSGPMVASINISLLLNPLKQLDERIGTQSPIRIRTNTVVMDPEAQKVTSSGPEHGLALLDCGEKCKDT